MDEGTKKGILFVLGLIINIISIIYFNSYNIPALIGIFLGIFFIVKALS